jgi:predicted dithiol-disulfide oxidoreductase (DUF899 family)
MTNHTTGTRAEHNAARAQLLDREKRLTRESDELARVRRELPWVEVAKEYVFDAGDGTRSLAELFAGRSQLLVYHFMFGERYTVGCPVCSSAADTFDGAVAHLAARDVAFTCVSHAPLDRLLAYRQRMGWSFPWASSEGSDFSYDFDVARTPEQVESFAADASEGLQKIAADCGTDAAGFMAEGPGLSAFALQDGTVYHTYSCYARGLECLMGYYPLLDRTAHGRDEGDAGPWMRRHDEYVAGGLARGR